MTEETEERDPRAEESPGGGIVARALDWFDQALKNAEVGKGPKVQLGTGAAAVGILVDNN